VAGLMGYNPYGMATSREQWTRERLIADNLSWPAWIVWAMKRYLRYMILISGTVWLVTMPLVMARFHLFTLYTVAINTLPQLRSRSVGHIICTSGMGTAPWRVTSFLKRTSPSCHMMPPR